MLCSFDSDLRAEMARQDRAEARGRERDRLVEIEAARLLDGDFDPLAPANFYEAVAETVDTMSVGRMLNALREGRHERHDDERRREDVEEAADDEQEAVEHEQIGRAHV